MSVRESIASAFNDVPYPDDQIALHECPRCRGLRDDFRGKSLPVLGDGVLERNCFDLALLSPAAFHHFVSAYMFYSLIHPDSEVAFFTCQNLGVDGFDSFYLQRFRLFSSRQKEAVIAFLEFFKSHESEDDDPDIRERQERLNKINVVIKLWKGLS